MTIRLRLALALVAAIAAAGSVLLAWTAQAQREAAIAQARDFARSVHQITLAGLTGMMIVGAGERRDLFLDQIEQARDIRGLRVIRSQAVIDQYGPGTASERASDAVERQVLESAQPVFEVRIESGQEYLKAVLPALASRDFLGKDCIACHSVAEGTVLGAVTLDIDLARVNSSISGFRRQVVAAGLVMLFALGILAYLVASSTVSAPLLRLAASLNAIGGGRVDPMDRLGNGGRDEISEAARAFDRALERAHLMVRQERISADVFENALEGILVTDRDARIIKVNPAFTRTTGYPAEEAIGRTPRMLQSGIQDRAFYERFWRALLEKGEWQGDIWNRRRNGEVYPEWLNISCVRDETGEVQNYVAIFSDITERKRHEALITHQAQHDPLTGLPNRALFHDRLVQAIAVARRNSSGLAVMFLDLDLFKSVNDTHGHEAGDELLRQVAERLRATVREVDTVARISGDEFTVLLPQVQDASGTKAVAAKLEQAVRQPYRIGQAAVHVGASIGVSHFPDDGQDEEALLRAADRAMYEAKRRGRTGLTGRYRDTASSPP
jgi:diguanylate cyclase (GGDEF)-like protein/PAS domain S-box-containing protein